MLSALSYRGCACAGTFSDLRPYDDHDMRPAMTLAAQTFEDAQALIDRGVASDGTHPAGTGYYVRAWASNVVGLVYGNEQTFDALTRIVAHLGDVPHDEHHRGGSDEDHRDHA